MKMIYICSPLRGLPPYSHEQTQANLAKAAEYSKDVAMTGNIPITPHLYFTTFLDDEKKDERYVGLKMGLAMLEKCDEVWVYGNIRSPGMDAEIIQAEKYGKQIVFKEGI